MSHPVLLWPHGRRGPRSRLAGSAPRAGGGPTRWPRSSSLRFRSTRGARHGTGSVAVTRLVPPDRPYLMPISRTLRTRGTGQKVSTDHLRQNVGPSRCGDSGISTHLAHVPGQRSSAEPIGRCQALLAHGRCPHAPSGVGGQPGRQAASRGQRSRRSWAQSGTKVAPCTLPLVTRALGADAMPGRGTASTSGFTGTSSAARAATLTF